MTRPKPWGLKEWALASSIAVSMLTVAAILWRLGAVAGGAVSGTLNGWVDQRARAVADTTAARIVHDAIRGHRHDDHRSRRK